MRPGCDIASDMLCFRNIEHLSSHEDTPTVHSRPRPTSCACVVSDVITDTDRQPIGSATTRLTCATPEPLASNLLPGENPAGGWHTKTDGVPARYEMRFYSLRFGALLAFTCLVSVFWIKSTPHDGGKLPM